MDHHDDPRTGRRSGPVRATVTSRSNTRVNVRRSAHRGFGGPAARRAVVLASIVIVIAGCGTVRTPGDAGAQGTARPLTVEQSVLLAETLVRNSEAGGASFVAISDDRATGRTLSLEGEIDWTRLEGRATLDGYADGFGSVTEIAWSRVGVAERRPDQRELLDERGETPDTFFLRAADLQQSALDRLITLTIALAADQAEDAASLREQPAAALLRTDTLRDTEVLVMRFSARSIYWIDPETGTLLRFEGVDASGLNPVVIDLLELGPRELTMPPISRLPLVARR